MAYKKISKDILYKLMVSVDVQFFSPNCINLVNIADLLDTSRYQVKKYMDELKADGMVQLVSIDLSDEEEQLPPYWGYQLTRKGVDTDYYREKELSIDKLITKHFGNGGE